MSLVLGVLGSPRKGGNTDLLLDAALEGARAEGVEVRKVVLAGLDIRPCNACAGCADGSECLVADDMTPLYGLIDEADAIIIASPVYFDGVSAQTKTFIDRGQLFWVRKYVQKRPGKRKLGAFLSVGARIRTDFACPEATVRAYMFTVNAELLRTLGYAGFEESGSIVDHPSAICDAQALGRELAARISGRNVH